MAITGHASNSGTTSTTTPTLDFGFTASAGDLIIMITGSDSGLTAHNYGGSWVELGEGTNTGFRMSAAYLIASGGETTDSVTGTGTADRWEAIYIRIPAGEWHGTTPPEINTATTGNSSSPDPGNIAPSWGSATNNIFIAAFVADDSVDVSVSAYPTNYSTAQVDASATTSSANLGAAVRLLTAASDNPGAFTISAAETWRAIGIAVRPAVSVTETRVYSQAQARIKQTYVQHAQAQAQIKQTYVQHAQAQAKMNAFGVNAFGQAQAKIPAPPASEVHVLYTNSFGISVTGDNVYGTGVTLAGANFQPNKDYLIKAWGYLAIASSSQEARLRLQHGGVNLTDQPWEHDFDNISNPIRTAIGGIRRISQGSSPTDVTLDPGTSGTADVTADVFLLAVCLDDLGTEGVDWLWNEVTADYTTTTSFVAQASVTLPDPGEGDWLIIADDTNTPGDATNQHEFEIRNVSEDATITSMSIEGEDTALDRRGHILGAVHHLLDGQEIAARFRHDAGTAGTVHSSRIFAVNLAVFAQSSFSIVSGPTSPTSWTTIAGVDPTPSVTANWVILGFLEHTNVVYGDSGLGVRLQVNAAGGGLVSNPNYGDDAPYKPGFDPTDIWPFSIGTVVELQSGASREINLDAIFETPTTSSAIQNISLVAFTTKLAGQAATNVHGQAQARIKQTYNAHAQAQAWIENTYNGLGQAQARIKNTYNQHGQAQAWVENTYRAFGQAQANIEQTYNVHGQAQARIKNTYSGLGQAQARIKNTYFGLGQAQGQIKQVYYGLGQANADIKQVYYGLGQAQARIKQTYYGLGQANADIKQTYYAVAQANALIVRTEWGLGQAQARIKNSYYSLGQSQAQIKQTYTQVAQAHARIKQTYPLCSGEGGGQIDVPIINGADDGIASGAAISNTATTVFVGRELELGESWLRFVSVDIPQGATITDAYIEMVFTQKLGTPATLFISGNDVDDASNPSDLTDFNNEARTSATEPLFTAASASNQALQFSVTSIIQEIVDRGGWVSGNALMLFLEDSSSSGTFQGYNFASFNHATLAEPVLHVEFGGDGVCEGPFGQAQAWIEQTYYGLGQAQARILRAYVQHGQAQGQIKQVYYGLGQANADIKQTYTQVGQAEALIKNTYYGLGQSQAQIKQVYYGLGQAMATIRGNAHGQAQGTIKQTYNAHGQSAAWIKNTYYGVGQANAWIEQTYYGLGQAQGTIKQVYYQHGQANADIKQTYTVCGQAQANIKQTYTAHGQANALIANTYTAHGQAQAKINAFGVNQHGQAQANIKFEGNAVHGQAQAKINSFDYNQHGQANAWIETTTNSHGQAQAQIKQTYYGLGQAQARVLNTYYGLGQANVDIKATSNAHGQANAYIILSGLNQAAQAQADILQVYYGLGQAAALILRTENAHGQAQGRILQVYTQTGQAQADIKQVYYGLGQAHATIRDTYYVVGQASAKINAYGVTQTGQAQGNIQFQGNAAHGQANAQIKGIDVNNYGQAQAWIETTYNVHGQAQADIKQTYTSTGQANAAIANTYFATGQANAYILGREFGTGQAQGQIKTTYYAHGQAQALVKNTYYGSGQANAKIYILGSGHGQAQAWVEATYAQTGQAQAYILRVSRVYGQAQALIRTGNTQTGQAGAWIEAVGQGHGQAQASIISGKFGSGQAQAQIILSGLVNSAQAQAYIIKAALYGQAQALIVTTHTLKNVVVSDDAPILIVPDDDANESVVEDEDVFEITLQDSQFTIILDDENNFTIILEDEAY